MGNSVRLSDAQLPEVWAAYRAALARLDIQGVPELYVGQGPFINASAIGSERPMVMLNSSTVATMDDLELRTVLGHEAGHILSDHLVYSTALAILIIVGDARADDAAVLRRASRCSPSSSRCWSGIARRS